MVKTLLLTLTLFAATGCDFTRDVLWPTTVTCGAPVASQLFTDVKQIAEQDGFAAVFSDKSISALEDLALSYGPDTVACVLSELLAKMAPRGVAELKASENHSIGKLEESRRAQRIAAFLQHHEIEVSQ